MPSGSLSPKRPHPFAHYRKAPIGYGQPFLDISVSLTKRKPSLPISLTMPLTPESGKNKPVFSKPCLCLSDTRHFRHFCRFRGSEERSPCFQWVECEFVFLPVFVKTAPFWQGTRTRFYQKTRFVPPRQKGVLERNS